MRGNILKDDHDVINGHSSPLFDRNVSWPKLLILIVVIFYTTIFALYALSYSYIFSGILRKEGAFVQSVQDKPSTTVWKDVTLAPQNWNAVLDTGGTEQIINNTTALPVSSAITEVNKSSVAASVNNSVHKDIAINHGNTSINVGMQLNGSSNSSASSSMDLNVSSYSNSTQEASL